MSKYKYELNKLGNNVDSDKNEWKEEQFFYKYKKFKWVYNDSIIIEMRHVKIQDNQDNDIFIHITFKTKIKLES